VRGLRTYVVVRVEFGARAGLLIVARGIGFNLKFLSVQTYKPTYLHYVIIQVVHACGLDYIISIY
jgi:hypothetical protein